ncbi:hypothetical protein BV25DRAFT_1808423, partial [Artomyces pyxidatus]
MNPVNESDILECLLREKGILDNEEQERALRMMAEHHMSRDSSQLLMYIAGVGGTGKSHVIKTIAEYFRRVDAASQLFVSAPTGIAAVLIEGYTIHALTFLPQS